MTRNKRGILLRLYRHSKGRLNYLLDRIIDLCDMVLMDVYRLPWPTAQNAAKKIARYIGDISWLLRAFPRLSAYQLIGTDWTIIFVGGDVSLREICHLFFEEGVDQQQLGRIALWNLSAQTQQWLTEGIDLVICELGCIHPKHPKAPIIFSVPTWIQQVLTIPEPLEALIAGKKLSTRRNQLNRARRAGFNLRFSQSKVDFDHFHYHMYLPYVQARHGQLALTARYQDQWQRWFVRGGLLLVTQHDKPVAGALCHMANKTCFLIEIGVLKADPQLFKQGIETVLYWYAITWGRDQGAKVFDMGSTRAWRSNGSFNNKRRWGGQVARRKKIYGTWTFLAQNLPPSLEDHINRLGFISEIKGKFYGVLLTGDTAFVEQTDFHNELVAAQEQGLAGLAVISPHAKLAIYDSAG